MKHAFLAGKPEPECEKSLIYMIKLTSNDNFECMDQYFFEQSIQRELSGDVDF
jgi:hypothetical protein